MKTEATFSRIAALAALSFAITTGHAFAIEYTFSSSGVDGRGNALSATATFNITGDNLQITLENTGAAAAQPSDVLTMLYFNLNGTPTLKPVSMTLGSGSSVLHPGGKGGPSAGSWEYMNTSGPGGATAEISTSGAKRNKHSAGGMAFGLVNGIAKRPRNVASRKLVNGSMVFDFKLPTGYNITSISDVGFRYAPFGHGPFLLECLDCWVPDGSGSGTPGAPGDPAPNGSPSSVPDGGSTAILMGLGLAGVGFYTFAQRKGRKLRLLT